MNRIDSLELVEIGVEIVECCARPMRAYPLANARAGFQLARIEAGLRVGGGGQCDFGARHVEDGKTMVTHLS